MKNILFADDNKNIREFCKQELEAEGYRVLLASDGEEAVRRINEGPTPDVVLLDLEMPGMGGLATLRQLAQIRPELPVIICSGMDDPTVVECASSLGAHAYLKKPVQQLYLTAALESCLNAPDEGGSRAASV